MSTTKSSHMAYHREEGIASRGVHILWFVMTKQ